MGRFLRADVRALRRSIAWSGCLVLAMPGCSSSDDGTAPSASTTLPTSVSPPSTSIPVTITDPGTVPTTIPPASTAADATAPSTSVLSTIEPAPLARTDINAITTSFLVFFGGLESTVEEKVAVLADGETYRGMLEAASENDQFQQMSTDIREIRAGSDEECRRFDAPSGCAIVVHDVLVGGFPMAAGIESPAISADGRWLVGSQAWCNIVEMGGAECTEPTNGSGA